MKKKLPVILTIAAAVLICGAIVLIALLPRGAQQTAEPTAVPFETAPTVSETMPPETAAPPATEPETEAPTEPAPVISAPDLLIDLLAQNGNTPEGLAALGCRQLVTVSSSGSSAQIRFFRLSDNVWTEDESLSCPGWVGQNGVTADMHEGGYATPFGLYPVGEAFYIYSPPVTGLPTFEITQDTYWVDDPDSQYYNMRVEGTALKDWNSAEHMIDYTTAYEYGFVIQYNTEGVYNAGSAIFFHVSYNPTAGCVGTDRESALRYLAALSLSEDPYILIV